MSLKDLVKDIILEQVVGGVKAVSGWKVLIVDAPSLGMISSCCRMFDIMEKGVTLAEDIRKSRQPMPTFDGLYLIAPTQENINLIIRDFKDAKAPKYAAVHVVFTDLCQDTLVDMLAQSNVRPYLKTCKELNLNFVPLEARVFKLNGCGDLHAFYSPKSELVQGDAKAQGSVISSTASGIASLCAALGARPLVRYDPDAPNSVTRDLATSLEQRLAHIDKSSDVFKAAAARKQARSQVLILDRSVDLMSPLVHELTYQAAAYDLLAIEKDTYEFAFEDGKGRKQQKKVVLGEDDDVWVKYRHHHISSVFKDVTRDFNDFVATAKVAQDLKKGSQTAALKDTLKELPQHQDRMAKFSLHLDMSSEINKAFTRKVEACTMAEQNIVCGEQADGTKVKDPINEIAAIATDRGLTVANKVRAIMLCALAKDGIPRRELENLMDSGDILQKERDAILALEHFGVNVAIDGKQKKVKKPKRKAREPLFNLSRWTPMIKDLMEDAIDGALPLKEFPTVGGGGEELEKAPKKEKGKGKEAAEGSSDDEEVQSARNKKEKRGDWAKGKNKKAEKEKEKKLAELKEGRPYLLVFVNGSVSFNEMRSAYEVAEAAGMDVFIGSHSILSPNAFVEQVGELNQEPKQQGGAVVIHHAADPSGLTIVAGKSRPVAEVSI